MSAVGILGIGTYLPPEVRTNDWWPRPIVEDWSNRTAARVTRGDMPAEGLSPGAQLTLAAMARFAEDPFRGAVQRRIMREGMTSQEMEAHAAREAISRAGITLEDVDVLLVQTVVPEQLLPNTACATHSRLELPPRVLTIATEAACNAFAAHASISQAFIESGRARYVLSVHSSAMNRVVRRTEPDSAWWGDGAAAVLWGPVSSGRGILSAVHRADGSSGEAIVLGVPGGRWWDDGAITLHSPNREQTRSMLFNIADRSREAITASLKDAGVSPAQVGFYASHQGTAWLSEVTAQHSGLGATPTIATFPAFGNISSVNIPLILAIAERERAIKDDTNIVTFSGGAGETWSSLCLRWGR